MNITHASPITKRQDLYYWLDQLYDGRRAIEATISKYGSTPALEAALTSMNEAISEYRHRIHDLSIEA
jgi:hypothetical protein